MKFCAPRGRPRFRPRAPLHPRLLSFCIRSGLGEEVTWEGGPDVREERGPLIRPRHEFDLLGLSAHLYVPGVVSVRLVYEAHLHPVHLRVEHAFSETEVCKRTGDDIGDWRSWSLLDRNLCGRAGE